VTLWLLCVVQVIEATTVKAVCTFKPTLPKKRGEDDEEEEEEDEEEGAKDRRAVEAFMSRYQVPSVVLLD
jgi:hypothetical protein